MSISEKSRLDEIAGEFDKNGFVKLEQVIAPAELEALREDTQLIIEGGYKNKENESDYFYSIDPESGEEVFHRVQYVFPKAVVHNSLLTLLAHPTILQIVQHILGDDFVCAAEAFVFKVPRNGREVPMHADCNPADPALSPAHLIFNVDFYLDDSSIENGCLWVAPGSHKLNLSAQEISERGWDFPDLVPVPMKAGDVLLHNIRLAHGSHKSYAPTIRRTLYYEFDRLNWLVREGSRPEYPINECWVQDRLRLMMHALDLRRKAPYAQVEEPFHYQVPPGYLVKWPDSNEKVNYRPAMGHSKYF
jgi:ectoine hydroxylase-related dioxygenase (phytanoyl-CoA dioxygenase family)